MKRVSLLTLAFAVLFLVFLNLLIVLRVKFPYYPLVSLQDIFDILTPVVLIPIYWQLFKGTSKAGPASNILFLVLAAIWVEGHGIHLSANSIHNLFDALARSPSTDLKSTDVFRLTYFFDEELGHDIWYTGILGMAAFLIYQAWHNPIGQTTWPVVLLAGLIHGFSYFAIFIEGQLVVLGLPFAAAVVALSLIFGREKLPAQPVLAFFFVASLVAFLLFAGWGLYWRGFPQFSDVGII